MWHFRGALRFAMLGPQPIRHAEGQRMNHTMRTPSGSHAAQPRSRWLFKAGSLAALCAAVVLLMAALGPMASFLEAGRPADWLASMASLWLIVIFKLHRGLSGIDISLLTGMNMLDLLMLALVAVVQLGLYPLLRRVSRVWAVVAAIQPLLGMLLFIATQNAGRSALMGSVLVASVVMLRGGLVRKAVTTMGIAASLLLLAGDFTAGVLPPSLLTASLFGAGYALLAAWFFILTPWLWRHPA